MITDFNKTKSIKVATVGGTPTISKTQCLKITSGDDSTTGTGEIVLDWTNISSKSDIAVYDENDTLLDYYFESFDDTEETAVIWVYRAWEQDDTVQVKIAYGNGDSDQSVGASTVFDNESDLQAGYLFNESSGDLLDVTSNGNDGTVNGATQGASGFSGGAYSFGGPNSGDYIDFPSNPFDSFMDGNNDYTIIAYFEADTLDGAYIFDNYSNKTTLYIEQAYYRYDGTSYTMSFDNAVIDQKYLHIFTYDSSNGGEFWVNGVLEGSNGNTGSFDNASGGNTKIGIDDQEHVERGFGGLIAHLRIYSSIISDDDKIAINAAMKTTPDFFSQEAAVSPTTLTGQITLNEVGVSATVIGYNETTSTFLGYSATDGSGNYTFTEAGLAGDIILVAAQHDGAEKYGRVKTIELS